MTEVVEQDSRAAAGRLAVAVAGRGLQDLPAAVPVPHASTGCPSARPRDQARGHAGARGAGAAVRPAGRPTARRSRGRAWSAAVGGCSAEAEPELAAACSPTADAGRAGWTSAPPRCSPATSRWRTRRRLEPGPEREQLCSTRSATTTCCSAATSTGSTSPRPATCGWSTTRPAAPAGGVRGAGAVPAEVLRAGAVAHPRRGAAGAAAALPQGRRDPELQPDAEELARFERTLVALWQAIERATPSGTSGRSRAGSAAGAATRRCARPRAARRRRSPRSRRVAAGGRRADAPHPPPYGERRHPPIDGDPRPSRVRVPARRPP